MELDFKKMNGLIPAIIQDANTGVVLMLGFMNEESLKMTEEKKLVTFWSRSRKTLWTKGETSGNFLKVKEILSDCDDDTLLIKAVPTGPVCHTGKDTCFFEENNVNNINTKDYLFYLESIIEDRRDYPVEGSYTNSLFARGINRIAKKVGEEAVETVIASKDEDKNALIGEAADLLYHLQVLLTYKDIKLMDVLECLKERHS